MTQGMQYYLGSAPLYTTEDVREEVARQTEKLRDENEQLKRTLANYANATDWAADKIRSLEREAEQLETMKVEREKYGAGWLQVTRERDALQETLTAIEHAVAQVYSHLSGGRISKCNTDPQVAIDVIEDQNNQALAEALRRVPMAQ